MPRALGTEKKSCTLYELKRHVKHHIWIHSKKPLLYFIPIFFRNFKLAGPGHARHASDLGLEKLSPSESISKISKISQVLSGPSLGFGFRFGQFLSGPPIWQSKFVFFRYFLAKAHSSKVTFFCLEVPSHGIAVLKYFSTTICVWYNYNLKYFSYSSPLSLQFYFFTFPASFWLVFHVLDPVTGHMVLTCQDWKQISRQAQPFFIETSSIRMRIIRISLEILIL